MSVAGAGSNTGMAPKKDRGFLGGLSQEAQRDLILLGVFVIVATLLQLLIPNGGWWEAMDTFVNNRGGEIDVVVPFFIMGAVGFGVYAFRRLKELQGLSAARERAQMAAMSQQQELEEAQQATVRAQQEAAEAQLMNRALTDTEMNVIVKVDSEGRILDANEGMEIATGLSKSRLVGSNAFAYFQYPERAEDALMRAVENGSSAEDPGMEIRNGKGESQPVTYRVSSYTGSNGETVGVIISRPREV